MKNSHFTYRLFLALFISGFSFSGFSNLYARDESPGSDSVKSINQPWEFKTPETDWIVAKVPFWNLLPGFSDYEGVGEFRIRFQIDNLSRFKNSGLLIPSQHNYTEIYLNDTPLTNPEPRYNGVHREIIIPIDDPVWKEGENTIYLRQKSYNGFGGLRSSTILLGKIPDLFRIQYQSLLWYTGIIYILVFLSFIYIMHFVFRKSEYYYLFFSFLSLVVGLWVAGFSGIILQYFPYPWVELIFSNGSSILILPALMFFLDYFLQGKIRIRTYIISVPFVFFLFWLFSEYTIYKNIKYYNYYVFKVFLGVNLLATLYVVASTVESIRNRIPWSKYIFTGVVIFAVGTIQTILVSGNEELEMNPLLGEGYFGMVLVFSIILSRRFSHVHQELEQAHLDLTELDRMKDHFLANTSHQIRTPLNGIVGIAESMLEGASGDLTEFQKYNIALIAGSGRRLSGLLGDILDYETLKKKVFDLNIQLVDLKSLTDLVITYVNQVYGFPDIKIENDIRNIPPIEADENRIQQILYHLIGNAVKFTKQGEVRIRGDFVDNETVQIEVEDNGPGIDPARVVTIFDEFEKDQDPSVRKFGGAGLGLAITRKLVELHGGSVTVNSSPGRGATFAIQLPLHQLKTKKGENGNTKQKTPFVSAIRDIDSTLLVREQPMEHVEPVETNRKILLVDDESVNLQVMTNFLKNIGHEVIGCQSGEKALEEIENNPGLDLVILDLLMPGLSGYEVLEIIREKYSFFDLPVMILTSRNHDNEVVTFLQKGANEYIIKPFFKSEFLTRVTNLLTLKSSVRSQRELFIQEREMDLAREVQGTILTPSDVLGNIKNYSCFVTYNPANGIIGGDYYSIHQADESSISIVIADAAGHGFQAALSSMQVDMMNRLLKEEDPGIKLNHFNAIFSAKIKSHSLFTSFIVNIKGNRLYYSGAGHPSQYLYRSDERRLDKLESRGVPVGVLESPEYKTDELPVKKGDILVLLTDGIQEASNADQELFGEERTQKTIEDYLRGNSNHSLDDLHRQLLDAVNAWVGSEKHYDDITVLTVRLM